MRGETGEAEEEFRLYLEDWYTEQGVPPADPLHGYYISVEINATRGEGERITRELVTQCGHAIQSTAVLDVGCGFCGAMTVLAAQGASVTGIDVSETQLRIGKHRLELHGMRPRLVRTSAAALPFPDDSFDTVLSTSVLEHVPPSVRPQVVSEAIRVLRPGGVLYLAFPNLLSFRNLREDPHYHLFGLTALPVTWANRITRRRLGRGYDAQVFPRVGEIKAAARRRRTILYNLSRGERALLARIENPDAVRRLGPRRVLRVLKRLRLSWLARLGVTMFVSTGAGATLVGRKP